VNQRGTRWFDSAVAAVLAAAAIFFAARPGFAFDARFHRQPKDLSPALASSLTDRVSEEAGPFLDKEDEKHKNGETYVDLQPKFEYLPNYGPGGRLVVSVKLGGAEYQAEKGQSGKGKASGRLKYLVFTYALKDKKWVEAAKPRWETQDLGPAAAKKMTAAAERAEKQKAALEARRKALQEAAEKAQKAANGGAPQ
jgi:hypothetical protein